jgi:hypothetical protein
VRRDRPLTDRDRELLAFVAEHRFALPAHAAALLGVAEETANVRLRSVARAGYLIERRVFAAAPRSYRIAQRGLDATGSELGRPTGRVGSYDHEVGAAWLWLAGRNGAFGPMRDVLSERRLRSHDASAPGRDDPLGVRLGAAGAAGRQRLHYPDLLLVDNDGRRIAIELELTGKGRTRRDGILAGYAADPRIGSVVYVVHDVRVARSIEVSARRLGIGGLVQIQQVARAASSRAAAGRTQAVARAPARETAPARQPSGVER